MQGSVPRTVLVKSALVLLGLGAGVLLLEGFIRLAGPALLEYDGGPEHLFFNHPELLPEEYRSRHPCLSDALPAPGEGRRILFLGDSVTRRGKIISALRRRHGVRKAQWLNAGIAGYNTRQELRLYRKSCRRLRPHHVVLTMHNNDFQDNRLIFQRPFSNERVHLDLDHQGPLEHFLTYRSHVYRLLLGRPGVVGVDPIGPHEWRQAGARMKRDLRQLRDLTRADGARLSVVLMPSLKAGRLPEPARTSHRTALELLQQLGIRHFDLQQVFFSAVAYRITLHEAPGDFLHPGQALADRFGEYLHRQGLLD